MASIYPASFIKRHLVEGSDSYRETLASLGTMDKDAVAQRAEYLKLEDALVEKAGKLLSRKETSTEDIAAFLESAEFKDLEERRKKINDVRAQTLRLATDAYNKVDDSIQALDKEIAMLEPQMAADMSLLDPLAVAIKQKTLKKEREKVRVVSKKEYKEHKRQLMLLEQGLGGMIGGGSGVLSEGGTIMEEVDPNEPVYCTCQRVSFGQMVGCENEDCRFEWFHYECVGLTDAPKGIWYCPECTALKEKEKTGEEAPAPTASPAAAPAAATSAEGGREAALPAASILEVEEKQPGPSSPQEKAIDVEEGEGANEKEAAVEMVQD